MTPQSARRYDGDQVAAGEVRIGGNAARRIGQCLFFAAEQFLSHYRQKLVVKSAQEELARKKLEEAREGGAANA